MNKSYIPSALVFLLGAFLLGLGIDHSSSSIALFGFALAIVAVAWAFEIAEQRKPDGKPADNDPSRGR